MPHKTKHLNVIRTSTEGAMKRNETMKVDNIKQLVRKCLELTGKECKNKNHAFKISGPNNKCKIIIIIYVTSHSIVKS